MESAQSKKETESKSEKRHDPFAVDIFGGDDKVGAANIGVLEPVEGNRLPDGVHRDWFKDLEVVGYRTDDKGSQTPVYPNWLEEEVNKRVLPVLSGFAGTKYEACHFEIISYDDVSFGESARRLSSASNLFVRFESGGSEGVLAVSSDFASAIIDRVLGGAGQLFDAPRQISNIELAICEYVAAAALSGLNSGLDELHRIRILDVSTELPAEIENAARGVETVGDLLFGPMSGMISILLPTVLIASLNKLFDSQSDSTVRFQFSKEFEAAVGFPSMHLLVGSTTVHALEIPFLEPDDVVLVSAPNTKWWRGEKSAGVLSCYLGSSSNVMLKGSFVVSEDTGNEGFRIIEAIAEKPTVDFPRYRKHGSEQGVRSVKEIKNSENLESGDAATEPAATVPARGENEAENVGDAGLVALENVMVDLRVQVAGRKISLSELGKLHAGQIIDLGCNPEDPVELVAENSDRPIASGELVRIEDQLGVRILKVFV